MQVNVGVGPRRVAVLRRAYLDGRLVDYCTALLNARRSVASPATTHPGPEAKSALAVIDAIRDHDTWRRERAA